MGDPSSSSSPLQRGIYRYDFIAVVILCSVMVSAVVLVTDHGGRSILYRLTNSPSPSSRPPLLHEERRGSDVTRSPPAAGTPSPRPPPPPVNRLVTGSGRKHGRSTDPDLRRVELSLSRARESIKKALRRSNKTLTLPDRDYVPKGPMYWNANAFHRSYLEMEKTMKVYVYEEGEPPLFHDGPCKSIYSTEGRFIYNMEMDTRMRTRDPQRAHVYFLPFSILKMIKFVREPNSFDVDPFRKIIADYIDVVSRRHPYWNRSLGADHFMVSCHDWAPRTSLAVKELYSNSIRVLCNANTSEGFNPSKDISLPEMNLKSDATNEILGSAPADSSHRTLLGFFAGGNHGPIRPVLLHHWKGKDNDLQVYEYLPRGISYYDMMKKSRFCLCPSGFEVASPRVVEAIYLECVPVIISHHYVLPFSDVLDWKAFSVEVGLEDIPNLKKILMAIPLEEYMEMKKRLKMVQRHFVVSTPPARFDMYHMLLHSVWLRRMNIRINA